MKGSRPKKAQIYKCQRCGGTFQTHGSTSRKRCPSCNIIARKDRQKEYYESKTRPYLISKQQIKNRGKVGRPKKAKPKKTKEKKLQNDSSFRFNWICPHCDHLNTRHYDLLRYPERYRKEKCSKCRKYRTEEEDFV